MIKKPSNITKTKMHGEKCPNSCDNDKWHKKPRNSLSWGHPVGYPSTILIPHCWWMRVNQKSLQGHLATSIMKLKSVKWLRTLFLHIEGLEIKTQENWL